MSEFKVSSMESSTGGAPSFTQGLNVAGADVTSGHGMSEYYTGATEPSSPANGAFWFDGTDLHQYINGKFRILDANPPPAWFGGRGVFGGGGGGNVIQYVTIDTPGNATDFGDLTSIYQDAYNGTAACSNGTYGLFGGATYFSYFNIIQYVTIATPGNAIDFGDLTQARGNLASCSNGIYGLFGGGVSNTNIIDYVTIATPGNATDFGDLTQARARLASCSNGIYGLFAGGGSSSTNTGNIIDYVTIATPGNATDFGNLSVDRSGLGSCANITYGLFAGGSNGGTGKYNTIDYVTIATPSNATDFGDLTVARGNRDNTSVGSCSNSTRGIFGGGLSGSSTSEATIDYVTIATPGNATDFGDLLSANAGPTACSGD